MNKKTLSITLLAVVCLLTLLGAVACSVVPSQQEGGLERSDIRSVQSELKFTAEQQLSRIKAEYLLKNKGYKDTDQVVVMVSGKNKSLSERYNDTGKNGNLVEYVKSQEGQAYVSQIESEQAELIDQLTALGYVDEVVYTYSTITNAVAIKTSYGNVAKIGKMASVKSTMLSDTFNRPQSTSAGDASAIVNAVDIYPTGIYNSSSVKYTGVGTAVAILDSGFDISHEVFSKMPNCTEDKLLINKNIVEDKLSLTQAAKLTANLKGYNVYNNLKVPFAYDYADKDYDVFPHDSEHGTHVAGIISGQSDTITGIAIDSQLVLLKVFPDLDDGGKTEDILAALEDAVLLNVDAINMSLGSSCGFSTEHDNENLNRIYRNISNAGISLITAASNSYSAGFSGEQGNTNKVTNPDSGTVGSPSTYYAALSVASISGTKSRYIVANGEQTFFFKESNSLAGKENDFYDELKTILKANGYTDAQLANGVELDYVTIPGVGRAANYLGLDVKGKVALVERGSNTFEEKAAAAKNAGAVACIIYNNIDGDILMSMGKTDHIPTISVSKDDGRQLAKKSSGKMKFSWDYQAGPFMSDFSSWGPTPSLELKPEITAHGGNILSSVPGNKYDELSGTSMATPNLCGIIVLIRQHLRESYPDYTWQQINNLANQLLMSTATIILNEEGNPYSPRKQGAGLASLYNVVNSKAIITVDGKDRTKLELGDDPMERGVYEMNFNVVNLSDTPVSYNVSMIGMTESVSTSDKNFVSETPYILSQNYVTEIVGGKGTLDNGKVTVEPNSQVALKVTYTLSEEDKEYIRTSFPYGMYVEGFVKLTAVDENEISLNAPFLAFFGDWSKAPLFDKTYYEVETEAHDKSIDDEDKIKADYFATTPYGSYYYNYIIPLGTYLYDIDETRYDAIPATEEHAALSNVLGSIDGISAVYAGLLRCAKEMHFTITDLTTGEVVYDYTDYDAQKSHSNGATPLPYYEFLKVKSQSLQLINNRRYQFKMQGKLDYENDGTDTNVRNSFTFNFTMDDEAPIIKSATYEKVYDKNLKKDRYYVYLTVYDNHYVQSITPILFTSSRSYTFLTDNPIPVYGEKGSDTTVKIEITDLLDDIGYDAVINSALAFSVDDYALNSNIFFCQLPGTNGNFKFTKNGEPDGTDMVILSVDEGEIVDLTQYLSTTDKNVDENKDYLKHLVWTSSNEEVVEVNGGQIKAKKPGKATIIAKEQMDLRQAVLIVNVRENSKNAQVAEVSEDQPMLAASTSDSLEAARFAYFDTEFAYSRAAQTSEIGATGDRKFLNSMGTVGLYPGEKIKLYYEIKPWYVKDNYEYSFESLRPDVATVDENGVVTALKEGDVTIRLNIKGSNIAARVELSVKSEFVIENRMLVAYKGLGGDVVIPDDEGILYIGAYAFCLYDTDNTVELPEDDYDANKIPSSNTTVTSVVIPEGVEEIQKYAFYNCTGLRSVVLPKSLKFIREYAFYGDESLSRLYVNGAVVKTTDSEASAYYDGETLKDGYRLNGQYITTNGDFVVKQSYSDYKGFAQTETQVVARRAFSGCKLLDSVDLSKIYALGEAAFYGCQSLSYADLSSLRNTGNLAFSRCSSLEQVTLVKDTKLSEAMFSLSGLTSVDVYNENCDIPRFCFTNCEKLTKITLHGDLETIGEGAFSECPALTEVHFDGKVNVIGRQAFFRDTALTSITLPNNRVQIGTYAFCQCTKLAEVVLAPETVLAQAYSPVGSDDVHNQDNAVNPAASGYAFQETAISSFRVLGGNNYTVSADGKLLLSDGGKTIVLAATSASYGDYTLPSGITAVADGAFSGTDITSLTVPDGVKSIGAYAFAGCSKLTTVTLPATRGISIGSYAFYGYELVGNQNVAAYTLTSVSNLDKAVSVGNYCFAATGITDVNIGADAFVGEGAFFNSKVQQVSIGANASFGLGAFQNCMSLTTVNMPDEGGVYFGKVCFAYDSALRTIDLSKVGTPEKLGVIEAQTFYGCTSLRRADLQNVKAVYANAFGDCGSLGYINIPNVEHLGEGAFGKYSQYGSGPEVQSVTLPNTLKVMEDSVFAGCAYLEEIVIPSSVTQFGKQMFAYCTSLKKVTLPSNLKNLGEYTFAGCTSLEEINLADVETVGAYCFAADGALTDVHLDSLKYVGEAAFGSSGIKSVNAPNLVEIATYGFLGTSVTKFTAPVLEKIGNQAFVGCGELTEFTFSVYITHVGDAVFYGCDKLKAFNYQVGSSVFEDGTVNSYARIDDGVLYTKMANGKYQLASVPADKNVIALEVSPETVHVQTYAGNANTHVRAIVFPDGLESIAAHAFDKYTNLISVEFRTETAPTLESQYDKSSKLAETAPGYGLLHNQFNLFDTELYYHNFIGLLGSFEPISMVLPANATLYGYDAVTYEGYFGKVVNAKRSNYVAMQSAMRNFIAGVEKIQNISVITLGDANLIDDTITAYNAINQNYADYGYTQAQWQNMYLVAKTAHNTLNELRLDAATMQVKRLQAKISALPTTFNVVNFAALSKQIADINSELAELKQEEKQLLDMTTYNALMNSYNAYRQSLSEQVDSIIGESSGSAASAMAAFAGLGLVALAFKRKASM